MHKYFRQGIAEKVALTSNFLQSKLAEFEALRAEIDVMQIELLNETLPLAYEGGQKP